MTMIEPGDLPAQLGEFEVTGIVGEGGMGQVVRAIRRREAGVLWWVAIKVLAVSYGGELGRTRLVGSVSQGENNREREGLFKREAFIGAALARSGEAANVVVARDFGRYQGIPYLVMDLVPGPTLQQVIAGRRGIGAVPLSFSGAVSLLEQVAAGLHIVHTVRHPGDRSKPLCPVHRDLKPANIFLAPEGIAKVADLGIAKPGDPSVTATVMQASYAPDTVRGTIPYMSPEQLSGSPLDQRSDLWAIGAIAYEALRGERLFSGRTVEEVVAGIVASPGSPLHQRTRDRLQELPESLVAVVERLISTDPGDRYQTAQELQGALRSIRIGAGGSEFARVGREELQLRVTEYQPDWVGAMPLEARRTGSCPPLNLGSRPAEQPKPASAVRLPIAIGVLVSLLAAGLAWGPDLYQRLATDPNDLVRGGLAAQSEGNLSAAVSLFKDACGLGSDEGCLLYADCLFDGAGTEQDLEAAVHHYQDLCSDEYPSGCNRLGMRYLYGEGVVQSQRRAADLFRGACAMGLAVGCSNWGNRLLKGEGVPKSSQEAAAAYRQGCDGGFAAACYLLGNRYAIGDGVQQDRSRARLLYEEACVGGCDDGCKNRDRLDARDPP